MNFFQSNTKKLLIPKIDNAFKDFSINLLENDWFEEHGDFSIGHRHNLGDSL